MSDRTVHLLRHAKSSWEDPSLSDRERPLSKRGRKACSALRAHLRDSGVAGGLQLVLCSPAVRAVQTLEGVRDGLPHAARVEIEDAIYAAIADRLVVLLRSLPRDVREVMLVGHNPGLEDLARLVADLRVPKYPTGGLATLRFSGPWRSLAPGGATLEAFITPREL